MDAFTIRNRKPGSVPAWFDRDKLRNSMFQHVNNYSHGTWGGVSTKEGIVWFRYRALVDSLVEASSHEAEVMALAVDRRAQNDLLFTVLKSLNDDCVHWEILGKGYMGINCSIVNKLGRVTGTAFLTPIKASWFNALPSWLDRMKSARLRNTVGKIKIIRSSYGQQ